MNHTHIALALLLFASGHALAQHSIEIHGISHHVGARKGEYNERNTGMGYGYRYSDHIRFVAHSYHNSYSDRPFLDQPARTRTSIAAAVEYTPMRIGPVDLGASAGLVTGYPQCALCPGGYLLARVSLSERAYIAVRGVPRIPNITRAIVAASVGVQW